MLKFVSLLCQELNDIFQELSHYFCCEFGWVKLRPNVRCLLKELQEHVRISRLILTKAQT